MTRLWLLVCPLWLGLCAAAQEDGSILSRKPATLPDYAAARGYSRADGSTDSLSKYWSRREYESARNDRAYRYERVEYASDGLAVVALLYRPVVHDARGAPTIVFNRGGAQQGDLAAVLLPFCHRLAKEGFVVVAPMLRESAGSGGKDELGGADLGDLMNAFKMIRELPSIDPQRVFLYGESRGGMMVYQALRERAPVRAAATFGGFTSLGAMLSDTPGLEAVAKTMIPDFDAAKAAGFERRSAVEFASRIAAPLLIMHGGADRAVDPSHSLQLALGLQRASKTYELLVFAGGDHTLSANQIERDERAIAWFRRHLE